MANRIWVVLALVAAAPAQEPRKEKAPGYLGVQVAPVDAETRAAFGIPDSVVEGVVIVEALPDTAAARAGLKKGDVLVQFAGAPVRTPEELVNLVRSRGAGDEVAYVLRRGEGTIDGRIRLGSAPEAPPIPGIEERLGRAERDLEELSKRLRRGPRTLADWRRAEEQSLEAARASGNQRAIHRGEVRVQLLTEMEAEGVRGLEERLDRLEKKVDKILERLGER